MVTPHRALLVGLSALAVLVAAGAGWFGGPLTAFGLAGATDSPYGLLGAPFLVVAALGGVAGWLTGGELAQRRVTPLRLLAPLAGLAGVALGAAAGVR